MNKNNPKPLYPTSEFFKDFKESYKALITKFLVYNNIEKVVCKDKKNHFFDYIEVKEDETLVVHHKYTIVDTNKEIDETYSHLLFDFTLDYAYCLADMEQDLFLQERQGKHDKYDFFFRDV